MLGRNNLAGASGQCRQAGEVGARSHHGGIQECVVKGGVRIEQLAAQKRRIGDVLEDGDMHRAVRIVGEVKGLHVGGHGG